MPRRASLTVSRLMSLVNTKGTATMEPNTEFTDRGRALEDAAIMRRLVREINELAERHPVSSSSMLLDIRADQIERLAAR